MKKIYLIIFCFFIIACDSNQAEKINVKNTNYQDIFRNNDSLFQIAYSKKGTSPNYVVFKAKNTNTGNIKEICSSSSELRGAIAIEQNILTYDVKTINYLDSFIIQNYSNGFEFTKNKALENISFYNYPNYNVVYSKAKQLNLVALKKLFLNNERYFCIHFNNDTMLSQLTFAHIMFKIGIITSRSSVASNNLFFGTPTNKPPSN